MAGVLTGGRAAGGVQHTTQALVGLRRTLAGHAAGGSGTVRGLRALGLLLGVGTLLLGLVRFEDPDRSVDLLAALALGWLVGWVAGPVVVRGAGQGLRPEWFALLPIPPRRLAAGLLGAALVGWAPVATLIALAGLVVTAARRGPAPLLVAVPAVLLLVALLVLASRVAPPALALTAALTLLGGQAGAWPWALAALPALLGGTAGLMVWISTAHPVPQKDPSRRSGPFDTGDDPAAAGAAIGQQYLMLVLVALTVVPGWALVVAGAAAGRPSLQAAGVLAGIATGVLLCWWGGRVATRRLTDHGAELMDLLCLGPQAPTGPEAAGPGGEAAAELPAWRSAARGALWTAGVVLIVPQGLVPIAFNLFGVDQAVKVWFAARYLEEPLQLPAALGCIVAGLVAVWLARRLDRRT